MTAARFFPKLYAGQTGTLELRTFAPEQSDQSPKARQQRSAAYRLRDFVPVQHGEIDMARVRRFIDGCTAVELGAFYGVALRTPSAARDRKGDAAHCQTLTGLFVDCDFKHLGEEETRARLAAFSIPPSIIVNSGGGMHPYWLLRQPLDLQSSYEEARVLLRRLAFTVAEIADTSVSEPARVLRIPGSKNFKYAPPRTVNVEQISDARIDAATLPLLDLTSSGACTSRPSRSGHGQPRRGTRESGVPFHLPSHLSGEIKERHETLRLLLRALQAHGVGIDAAIEVCLLENTARCRPPLPAKEVKSYLRRAADYADRPNFVRTPKTGWSLAGSLIEIGLSVESTLLAVHSVTPDFDPAVGL